MFSNRFKKKNEVQPPRRRTAQLSEDAISYAPRSRSDAASEESMAPLTGDQFRRNRTLSSYRPTPTNPEPSTRSKAHQLTQQRRRAGGLFSIVFGATVLLLVLLWQLIAQVEVASSTKQIASSFSSEAYEKSINDYLALNPTQRLRAFLDTDALSAFVSDAVPEVAAVELKGFSGLAHGSFAVTFRVPVAGWQIGGEQYFVDAQGVVFKNNYYETPNVQIVDESGVPPEQGTAVAGSRLLGFIGKIVSGAGERGYTVEKVVLPIETTRTIDAFFAGSSTRARFTIDRGAGEQLEDFDRSVKHLSAQGVTPEYIDVRVSNRAAYK